MRKKKAKREVIKKLKGNRTYFTVFTIISGIFWNS